MAEDINLKAIITAVDKLSPVLAIIKGNANELAKTASNVAKAFANLGSQLAAPAAAFSKASIAGVAAAVTGFVDLAKAAQNNSTSLGISAAKLTAWQYAAEQSGVENDSFIDSLAKLNRNLKNVSSGGAKPFVDVLQQAGVSVKDINGKVKTATELFPELVAAFNKLASSSGKARFATQLFGKSGQDLIPLLAAGSKGLSDMENEANKLGISLNDATLAIANNLGASLNSLSKILTGLSNSMLVALAPALIKLIKSFKEWYIANQAIIKQKIALLATAISQALAKIDFSAVFNGIVSIAKAVSSIVQFFGGWKAAIIAVAFVLSSNLILALSTFVNTLEIISAALAANPIAIAIAGLAYAGYEIYKNWDGIKAYFIDLWADLKDIFNSAVAYISELLSNFNPLNKISSAVSGIKNLFSGSSSDINSTSNINQNNTNSVNGAIEVKFANAPVGTRVSATSNSDVNLNTNVGYTYGGAR